MVRTSAGIPANFSLPPVASANFSVGSSMPGRPSIRRDSTVPSFFVTSMTTKRVVGSGERRRAVSSCRRETFAESASRSARAGRSSKWVMPSAPSASAAAKTYSALKRASMPVAGVAEPTRAASPPGGKVMTTVSISSGARSLALRSASAPTATGWLAVQQGNALSVNPGETICQGVPQPDRSRFGCSAPKAKAE